ncbi:MAG: serine/threonine protein kinase, partial [Victivallales bacterium]|nr:serine/threonine protein kinase [Victivallales bacterium]
MPRPGDNFAGCRILARCGTGAFGAVYLVQDAIGHRLALKIFHEGMESPKLQEALQRYTSLPAEATTHLVQIRHFGMEDGRLYYLMEAADNASRDCSSYCPDTLEARLKQQGRLSLQEALAYFHQVLDSLEYLHERHFVHRDVKPANLLFIQGKLKLGDTDLLGDYTRTLSATGSLGYTPPDFFFSQQPKSPSGDLYALGKVLYCCVTGEQPESFPHYPQDLPIDTLCHVAVPLSRICAP